MSFYTLLSTISLPPPPSSAQFKDHILMSTFLIIIEHSYGQVPTFQEISYWFSSSILRAPLKWGFILAILISKKLFTRKSNNTSEFCPMCQFVDNLIEFYWNCELISAVLATVLMMQWLPGNLEYILSTIIWTINRWMCIWFHGVISHNYLVYVIASLWRSEESRGNWHIRQVYIPRPHPQQKRLFVIASYTT